MKRIKLILMGLQLDTNAPGKSWGVPMSGDVIMTHDESKTNVYFTIHTIKNTPEGTQYSVTEISKLAAYNRQVNMGYQCFAVHYLNETLGQIAFKKSDC
jgi:hypothetical protein